MTESNKQEDPAVTRFRQYLRIKSVHPTPDYDGAIKFLKDQAKDIGLPFKTVEVHPERIVFVLNSHTDVVPVFEEHWKCDPWDGVKMENGDIYGRGTQDMKSNGCLYMEAVRRMKAKGIQPLRTIYLTFVPDEEIGGTLGMMKFVKTEEFKKMNVACAIDEGLANPTNAFTVFYGERAPWWVRVHCPGKPGHGSRFIEDNAAEKFRKVINSFLEFRAQEEKKLKGNACIKLGEVTTINLTNVQGGSLTQFNLVPTEFCAGFDIRITPTVDFKEFEDKIKKWCAEAGDDVKYEFKQKCEIQSLTSTDSSDPWWNCFETTCKQLGMTLEAEIFPAATDSRFFRELGIPAFGFSPMNNTPILLHDHNEFLNENVFLKGIDIFCEIIPALANLKGK
ncbi:ACY1 [Mytilus edulis]|uniref:N-acyl-aliphatic-L-amino acid amidohydrolase n=1 Tax=Mytilus edulis TaxID=6550 RepID=A0A8S3U0G4_MYTED|nr:ACY1 [Mytilus edulis]